MLNGLLIFGFLNVVINIYKDKFIYLEIRFFSGIFFWFNGLDFGFN